jgi:hypothetical protein
MNMQVLGLTIATMSLQLHGNKIELPDTLVAQNGEKVTTPQQWAEKRRPEILELFCTHVYGRAPVERPDSLRFEVTSVSPAMDGKATRKLVTISYRGPGGEGKIDLVLFVPSQRAKAAACFLMLNNRGPRHIDSTRENKSEFWPAEEIVARGYAAAAINLSDIDPDKDDGFKDGVHGVFDAPGKRVGDAWATIGAWAWGASRCMDYLQTDADIDPKRIAVIGHSRGGKTALWAGAQDERFALVISNESGSTGAALARGKQGENIAKINEVFPHWFSQNYKGFNNRENELPVDQHMLLALTAPRLLYIASATEDATSDPEAEFASALAASPVYGLFGLKGLDAPTMPAPDTPSLNGSIGYHNRTGKHDLTSYDWNRFMDFADLHWK